MSAVNDQKKKIVKKKKTGKSSKRRSIACSIPCINPLLQDFAIKGSFLSNFKTRSSFVSESIVLHSQPFSICVVNSFLKADKFLEQLRDELVDEIFIEKNNDLYKFQQTDDFKKSSGPYAQALRDLLYHDVKGWLTELTGIQLNEKIDITCSRYDYTDTLLCHDDELETRRIAFVLYLVPPWKEGDGGNLDLYDMDEHLQPKNVVKSIVPQFNNFVWFEVTEASHHQVSEVLCQCKSRLTVNGWFHGEPVPRADRYIEPVESPQKWLHVEEDVFFEWINPIYLDPEVQSQIQEKFEADSEIELQGFLQEEKYQTVVEALKSNQMTWKKQGPPNKRCFDKTEIQDTTPDAVRNCARFLQSEMMFLILSNLTGLSLHPLADFSSDSDTEESSCSAGCSAVTVGRKLDVENEVSEEEEENEEEEDECTKEGMTQEGETEKCKHTSKRRKIDSETSNGQGTTDRGITSKKLPSCLCKVRRWSHGCYTLLHDTDAQNTQFSLDAMLYCNCKDWGNTNGGYTSYIAKGEDEELLTVLPTENALALVYRDKETLRFVKHINDSVNTTTIDPHFYDFSMVYWE